METVMLYAENYQEEELTCNKQLIMKYSGG